MHHNRKTRYNLRDPIRYENILNSSIHTLIPLTPLNSSVSDFNPLIMHQFLIACSDGSIGLYDLDKFSWTYLRNGGHTETVFAISSLKLGNDNEIFDPMIFATASYDGTIKIWDLNRSTEHIKPSFFQALYCSSSSNIEQKTSFYGNSVKNKDSEPSETFVSGLNSLIVRKNIGTTQQGKPNSDSSLNFGNLDATLLDSFPVLGAGKKNEAGKLETKYGVWYCLAWAPDSSLRLVAGSSRGSAIIYNAKLAKVELELFNIHSGSIFQVSWNAFSRGQGFAANKLAFASHDGDCSIVDPESGAIVKKLKHPSEIFGCNWSPFEVDLLATCGNSGDIYLWDVSEKEDNPLSTLEGHKSKVFNVSWSPLDPNLLASVSDDCTIRIWLARKVIVKIFNSEYLQNSLKGAL
jgi:WD40 repeat protein